eukprot:150732-Pyramimonas_sp.AAC.1
MASAAAAADAVRHAAPQERWRSASPCLPSAAGRSRPSTSWPSARHFNYACFFHKLLRFQPPC